MDFLNNQIAVDHKQRGADEQAMKRKGTPNAQKYLPSFYTYMRRERLFSWGFMPINKIII